MFQTIPLLFFLIAFAACSSSDSVTPSVDDTAPAIKGKIHLDGGTVTVGTNEKSFRTNERPAMEVNLDYDFYMDVHEVTCGEYALITKDANCATDSLPITNVTYYDAILFANARRFF